MMPPCLQIHLQQKVIIRLTYQPIVQDSLFTLRHFLIISITLVLLLIAHQIVHQFSFRLLRGILYDSPVSLLHLTGFEHFIEAGQRLAGLGKYNKTAHGAVQPVGNTDEDITGFLVFLLQDVYKRQAVFLSANWLHQEYKNCGGTDRIEVSLGVTF